jgi:modulator of FtsH protease HflC
MRKTGIVVVVLVVLLALLLSMFIVDQKEQAVVTQFGKPVRVIVNPIAEGDARDQIVNELRAKYEPEGIGVAYGAGIHFRIPLIHSVRKFERRLLRWNGSPQQILTKEKKGIWLDPTARWFIKDPLQFFRAVGTEEEAHARLDDIIDSTVKNSIALRDLIEIVRTDNRPMVVAAEELKDSAQVVEIQAGRTKIVAEITQLSIEECEKVGIGIHPEGVIIKGLNYTQDVKKAVEDRMIAERQRIAEKSKSEGEGEYQKVMGQKDREVKVIISEAYKEAQGIEGAADAQATQIYADTYGQDPEFYRLWKTLELYEKGIVGDKTKLVLGTDNPLFGLIKGDFLGESKTE